MQKKHVLQLHAGLLMVAFNIHFILVPNSVAAGGISGLSVIIHEFLPNLSLGVLMIGLNVSIFCIGFAFLGFTFGFKTVYASLVLSLVVYMLDLYAPIRQPVGNDLFIQLVFGFSINAYGMALIFSHNASTGGTDILAMILNKWSGVRIGVAVLLFDLSIALVSSMLFGIEKGMYAVFGVFLNGVLIDTLLQKLKQHSEVVIISHQFEHIQSFILQELKAPATVHVVNTNSSKAKQHVITVHLMSPDVTKLKRFVLATDSTAYLTITQTKEIYGSHEEKAFQRA